jgi:hypothetical protein
MLRFVPTGQFSGVLEFAGQKLPAGHFTQLASVAIVLEKVPAGHEEHVAEDDAPAVFE